MDLSKIKQVHFIGIGGIGISAIARMFLAEGKAVSGSDQGSSPVTEELIKLGAQIAVGHAAENVPAETELVVYTIAVTPDNPELVTARERELPTYSYPQMLGLVSGSKYTIAVAGTHGKTTTTAMLAKIFIDVGLEPTVIVGSFLKDQKSNFIAGTGEYFIVEACEYRRSFLNLNPQVLVITNIDNDHLDYYRDLADIQSAFVELAQKVPADGYLICDTSSRELAPVVAAASCQVLDYRAVTTDFALKVPGAHNIKNAQAALAVAETQAIAFIAAAHALGSFSGTWRRFEYRGLTKTGAQVYDDYGHHPTEVKATLAGVKGLVSGKVFVAFQPHLYSRTKQLFKEFSESFTDAGEVIVLPIYAAREAPDPTISAEQLALAITNSGQSAQAMNFETAIEYLGQAAGPEDLILTMGAGDVFKIAESLV
jgi:UDP-N-acetylmuramate--alanine ligase